MGFSNGYDSGYADAIEDVRNGKVAGLGPASGGGSGDTSDVRRPTVFTFGISGSYEYDEGSSDEYAFSPVDNAVLLQSSSDGGIPHVQGPAGGFIAGDTIIVSGPGTYYLSFIYIDSREVTTGVVSNPESVRAFVYFGPDNGWVVVEQPAS